MTTWNDTGSDCGPTRRSRRLHVVAVLLASSLAAGAGASTRMLVVAGLGGEPDYAEAFAGQAEVAARQGREAGADVELQTGELATGAGIEAALEALANGAGTEDTVVVQLIGHGSWDDEHYRFNVPGPDLTAEDLAGWLEPIAAGRQLVILAASGSGAAVDLLAGDGRAVIAATRSGREQNAVVFGRFWAQALTEPSADVDKSGTISAGEAFRFAEQAVARHFESHQRIATEHPRLHGAADGFVVGVVTGADSVAPVVDDAANPEVARLSRRTDELAAAIEALKADKNALEENAYFTRLQGLLLELAPVERRLRELREARADERTGS